MLRFETPPTKKERKWASLEGLVIEVEGNIGSGKSTVTKAMKSVMNNHSQENTSEVFFETINNAFLAAFYTETKRFSFAFQMYMLTTRLYQMEEATRQAKQENRMVMLDRGAVGDTVFALLNHKMGNMDDTEINIYKSVCRDRMPRSISENVDMVLYLDVDPAECHRRVTGERKNDAEEGIPLAYLQAVDECYFHLMMDWMGSIDANHSDFIDTNCGPPPPLCVMRWEKYGTPSQVIIELERVARKQRRVPTIRFDKATAPLEEAHVKLETQAQVDEFFATLGEHDPCFTEKRTASINWALEHSNNFRRVSFGLLAQCMDIHFYGRTGPGFE
jgi:thymidine kinase/deoxynucleoside kinase